MNKETFENMDAAETIIYLHLDSVFLTQVPIGIYLQGINGSGK